MDSANCFGFNARHAPKKLFQWHRGHTTNCCPAGCPIKNSLLHLGFLHLHSILGTSASIFSAPKITEWPGRFLTISRDNAINLESPWLSYRIPSSYRSIDIEARAKTCRLDNIFLRKMVRGCVFPTPGRRGIRHTKIYSHLAPVVQPRLFAYALRGHGMSKIFPGPNDAIPITPVSLYAFVMLLRYHPSV